MYIGQLGDRGLQTCVMEVLKRSFEEWLEGRCNEIAVKLHRDGSVSVKDDSCPLSMRPHPKYKIPTMELYFTVPIALRSSPHSHFGLNGVGPPCVNALSEWFIARAIRDGTVCEIKFERGKVRRRRIAVSRADSGMLFWFKPDLAIFGASRIDKALTAIARDCFSESWTQGYTERRTEIAG